ncbi:Na+/H+ antiporter NhaC family protein [Shewanella sp. NIFS-20-20]|uniref:Na+/H+ antiporter NhaC family protein n=1 Tax=Shewanella sp. NIFS-20-20 TaxID=2853806 RepID=UPI001C473B5A|nr:Na+/H+ antiporter NhaC family protein [Shewanella sp. NIFS-20-20]MBV7316638.1 Na+/H+ antiporter NhaC family protein [Shewanella sp. NIFS-20-20]
MTNPNEPSASAMALLPLLLFLVLFIGSGIYFSLLGRPYAFYQIPAPIAALPSVVLALALCREPLESAINRFLDGVGHRDIMSMCMVYLLAGGFGAVAKATGGVDATVNLGLALLPGQWLLPGMFIITAFICTAMGTSTGTIAATAPVAFGMAQATGIDVALMAGAVMGGAMFGDNLSIISDTTIAATRTQQCEMRDKFRENIFIAGPAGIVVLALYFFSDPVSHSPTIAAINWLNVLPYLAIVLLALLGVNVYLVLSLGIVLAGLSGLLLMPDYTTALFAENIYHGFGNMQSIFYLTMLIGGLSELVKARGGLTFLNQFVSRVIAHYSKSHAPRARERAAEFGIAALVSMTTASTANNAIGIIVSGSVAHSISQKNGVSGRRSASLLDIFSCVIQGVIPYGAQALLLASSFAISPLQVVASAYYCYVLAVVALIIIWFRQS